MLTGQLRIYDTAPLMALVCKSELVVGSSARETLYKKMIAVVKGDCCQVAAA